MGNQGGWVFTLETLIYTLAPFVTIVVPFEDIKYADVLVVNGYHQIFSRSLSLQ
jgi:hypothetical protein